jgi:hypothetical protein
MLTTAQVDDIGVREWVAGAGVDYGYEDRRRLPGIRRFVSCDGKSGEGKGASESQERGVAHQGTGGLPLFERVAARITASINPKIIPILMGPPWRASSF